MQVLSLEVPQSIMDFGHLNASIAKEMLNPMSNKHRERDYYNFCINGYLCLWRYCGIIIYTCIISLDRLKYCKIW